MSTKQLFEKLSKYLSPVDVERIKINMALKGSIVMCLAIADICKSYNSTQENEKEVSRLLSMICKRHFNSEYKNIINN
jgi:hypothetical protein